MTGNRQVVHNHTTSFGLRRPKRYGKDVSGSRQRPVPTDEAQAKRPSLRSGEPHSGADPGIAAITRVWSEPSRLGTTPEPGIGETARHTFLRSSGRLPRLATRAGALIGAALRRRRKETALDQAVSVVEVMGFEPTASSVRGKRSSGLSYTPRCHASLILSRVWAVTGLREPARETS